MPRHRTHRRDINQTPIEQALKQVGATLADLSQVGAGVTDLLVGYRGVNFLLEIKNPNQSPSHRKLTEKQQEFHAFWRGQKTVVETVDDALKAIGAIK